jgi:uncharacterized protein
MSQDPYAAPVTAPMSPAEERRWGAIAHIVGLGAMIVSAGFLGFVGSLIIYLMCRDKGPFVRAHAANSLNVQIMTFIWLCISAPLILVFGLGLLTGTIAVVVACVLHVIGAMKANNGEWWDPPLTPRFVR